MPRIENMGQNVEEWCDKTGNGSSTYDVCQRCYKKLLANPHGFKAKLVPYNGDPVGTDGWGGDVDHPSYEDEDYKCEVCNTKLKERDDIGE